jgi:uncharacterized membrane protein YcaP (DUF421 family)
MIFYLIYFALDLPAVLRPTLIRGGLFIAAFTFIEFIVSLIFGSTDGSAAKDAINFFTSASLYLMLLFFLMIFLPRIISKIIFLKENKNEVRDPVLMHKMWEEQ